MKAIKYSIIAMAMGMGMTACTNLDEKVYDRIDAGVYYQNEASVKGALAAIYGQMSSTLAGENFFHLSEYPADQITWRVWNGGLWGWDEAMKTVLSWHNWTSETTIIREAWNNSWTGIGLANLLLNDLQGLSAASIGMSNEKLAQYVAEVRTLRAWNYYCIFELWGGALPLNTSAGSEVPGTADPDWDTSCRKIYDFIATELDETVGALAQDDANHSMVNRANQAMNRMLKARLLLNAEVFIGEKHYDECEALSKEILNGKYGNYDLDSNYRNLYSIDNVKSPEVVFALACEDGQGAANAISNVRTMVGMPLDYEQYFGQKYDGIGGWNCVCLVPSYDNSGTVLPGGGTIGAKCFLGDYGDKLGAPYERFDDRDIRKQNYVYDTSTKTHGPGMFLKGLIRANFGTGEPMASDAERKGQDLDYVDQLGTFLNVGRDLETVMSPRWGENNSGIRLVKYPLYPADASEGFKSIDDVQFRLAEVYYNIAECEMRKGNGNVAKEYVDAVRQRYFKTGDRTSALSIPGPGFTAFDMDWMLSEWGKEYLGEGNRRRTDLRRFDKFTQGQWWFWGRATEDGVSLPAKRDRKFEWYPLPQTAISVNPGLIQNPAYK
ncbi:RagB/SusD family nutrient uptake outer membrane protein [Prevotella sp. tc2-28]|uniref:RagB/SusD family nutrient uptake outer membrane protein n=1 Tax=Prevotella sp. tc2-28 TaxID=1761888 RepID=UPI000B805E15|nr:RagB/SusD family nutrient uptake outer membrane protein [Prevotella sp. tc2-28]